MNSYATHRKYGMKAKCGIGNFSNRPWFRPACAVFAVAGTVSLGAKAQVCGAGAQSAIATDRPQVTNSSIVVPCGSLQLENGLQVTGSSGQRSVDVPETSVRFGIARKTELRFMAPDYFHNASTSSGLLSGVGDVSLGVKQQLGPRAGFDFSVIPSVSFPTGSDALSSRGYDPAMQLPWSRSLTKAWTAAGQFGIGWPTQSTRRNVMGQSSLYFDRQLTSLVDVYLEYSGVFPQRGGPQHLIDFGAAYKPTPHQQLDLHCGFGLSSASPDYAIGFGYSARFQVIRSK